jgi:hypothetical protein
VREVRAPSRYLEACDALRESVEASNDRDRSGGCSDKACERTGDDLEGSNSARTTSPSAERDRTIGGIGSEAVASAMTSWKAMESCIVSSLTTSVRCAPKSASPPSDRDRLCAFEVLVVLDGRHQLVHDLLDLAPDAVGEAAITADLPEPALLQYGE